MLSVGLYTKKACHKIGRAAPFPASPDSRQFPALASVAQVHGEYGLTSVQHLSVKSDSAANSYTTRLSAFGDVFLPGVFSENPVKQIK